MVEGPASLLPGTMDVLILKAVSLCRLERRGLLDTEWGISDNNRRAKFYRLTTAGWKRLRGEATSWNRMVSIMAAALESRPGDV